VSTILGRTQTASPGDRMHGIGAYWVVDLDAQTVAVLELGPGCSYVEVATAEPGAPVTVQRPFPVTVGVDALLT